MIGAALIGFPFAFYYLGLPFGIILNLIIGYSTYNTSNLYFLAKDLTGGCTSSSEIGYKLYGRVYIFFITALVLVYCSGCILLYYNIFGNIAGSLYG